MSRHENESSVFAKNPTCASAASWSEPETVPCAGEMPGPNEN